MPTFLPARCSNFMFAMLAIVTVAPARAFPKGLYPLYRQDGVRNLIHLSFYGTLLISYANARKTGRRILWVRNNRKRSRSVWLIRRYVRFAVLDSAHCTVKRMHKDSTHFFRICSSRPETILLGCEAGVWGFFREVHSGRCFSLHLWPGRAVRQRF